MSRPGAVRVILPAHLRRLANVSGEVVVAVREPVTLAAVLDALEERHPVLRGTIRDAQTGRRRPLVRFFASHNDISHAPPETLLPPAVAGGAEPLHVVGAVAGG